MAIAALMAGAAPAASGAAMSVGPVRAASTSVAAGGAAGRTGTGSGAPAVRGDRLTAVAHRDGTQEHPGSVRSQGVADLAASLIGLGMRRPTGRLLFGGGG